MVLLSIAFMVLTLMWFVFVPYFYMYMEEGPRAATQQHALAALYEGLEQPDRRAALRRSPVLRDVAAANPHFRYYVREGSWQASYGGGPRWLHAAEEARALISGDERNSTFWSASFQVDGVAEYASYQFAQGRETYIEIAGVENAMERSVFPAVDLVAFWWASRSPLVAASGVLAIALVVLLLAVRSLRGLTRTVRSFNVDNIHLLPEEGLPAEVAPLIHAINEMMGRVNAEHAQQELFVATAAHELRTPVAILRTRLEMLADSDVKEELRQDLRRMSQLVNQLLRLTSIRNRRDLPEAVDIVAIAREVIAKRAPSGMRRGVDMEMAADIDSLMVRGDHELLKVAIANLLDNAVSFSSRGDTLTITVGQDGGVCVCDCGPGIAEGDVERIFEPFTKKPPHRKGHGLGLAIVKSIMGLHGGTVSAHNNVGGGATFTLQFQPLADAPRDLRRAA